MTHLRRHPRVAPLVAAVAWALGCPAEPPQPPKGQVPAGCSGTEVDLSQVFAQGHCVVAEATEAPAAGDLKLELAPAPLDVVPGQTGELKVTLRNISGAELAFDLKVPCEPALGFPIQITTPEGDRALQAGDPAVEDARSGTACDTTEIVRVGLPAGGKAVMPLSLRACEVDAAEPCTLPTGQHPMSVTVPLPRVRPAAGVLRVALP